LANARSKFDAFISYAREDERRARQTAEILQSAGLRICWDKNIVPGEDWANRIDGAIAVSKRFGPERQSDRVPILSRFLESDKFSLGDGHALRFQQQVVQVLVPPASSEQGLDIAIDGLYHPETNLHAAVIENSTEMID
jgi:hypothetical protein